MTVRDLDRHAPGPDAIGFDSAILGGALSSGGHVFLSYVREDADRVDTVEALFKDAGVAVWRDKNDLWPGEDWKVRIREAIVKDALVVVVCFSSNSAARDRSYQNEELLLAIDVFRQRAPGRPWIIPVRLDECELPDFDLGGGRTLDSLQRVDLFGDGRDGALARVVGSVVRLLPADDTGDRSSSEIPQSGIASDSTLKRLLRDPNRDIELEDALRAVADGVVAGLTDGDRFPTSSAEMNSLPQAARFVVGQLQEYLRCVEPACQAMSVGGAWGREEHEPTFARLMERIASTADASATGMTALVDLRRFAILPPLYVAAIAAVDRGNFGMLKAVTTDARIRINNRTAPMVAAANPWWAFSADILAQPFAFATDGQEVTDDLVEGLNAGRIGKRYTPISDALHTVLKPMLEQVIWDEGRYTERFDEAEVWFGVLEQDAILTHRSDSDSYHLPRPSFGSFTWRYRHMDNPIEVALAADAAERGADWKPLSAGLFGGSIDRATAAFTAYNEMAAEARLRRW